MDKPIGISISCLVDKERDYGREMYGRYNKKGRWIVEDYKYFKAKKEDKKVKKEIDFDKIPYFETKVIKVKKEKRECKHKKSIWHSYKYENIQEPKTIRKNKKIECNNTIKCSNCGGILSHTNEIREKMKGNFVNGENLDRVKFPCLCKYKEEESYHKGIIHINGGDWYELFCVDKQDKWDFIDSCKILRNLISSYDVHILKGKILIFEEVK